MVSQSFYMVPMLYKGRGYLSQKRKKTTKAKDSSTFPLYKEEKKVWLQTCLELYCSNLLYMAIEEAIHV